MGIRKDRLIAHHSKILLPTPLLRKCLGVGSVLLLGLLPGPDLVPVLAAPLLGIEQDPQNNTLRIRTQQPVVYRVEENNANTVVLFLPGTESGFVSPRQSFELGEVEFRSVNGGLQMIYKPRALGSTFDIAANEATPQGQTIEIQGRGGVAQPALASPPTVPVPEERVSLRVRDGDVKDALTLLGRVAQANVVTDNSVTGKVSVNLDNVPFSDALKVLVQAGNLTYVKVGDVYLVSQPSKSGLAPLPVEPAAALGTDPAARPINLNVKNAELGSVIENLANQAGVQLLIKDQVVGRVTGRLAGVPFEKALTQVLTGTRYGFTRQEGAYLIGDATPGTPTAAAFDDVDVIRLAYTDVKKMTTLLPAGFPTQNIKTDPVRNALVVSGSASLRTRVAKFVRAIDTPIKQVVFEIKIVELPETISRSLNTLSAFETTTNDTTTDGTALSLAGQIALDSGATGGTLNLYNNVARLLGLVQGYVTEGKAKLITDTKLTTFSGNPASIDVSQDINLTLSQNTSLNGIATQNTNIQTIRAGTLLEIEPVVQADGNVMTKLKVESSTPGSRADTSVAPDVSRRKVSNMLLIKDGETVEIGGLIQNNVTETITRLPILGYLPLIGQLFTDTSVSVEQRELMVFITPRIRDVELDAKARILPPEIRR